MADQSINLSQALEVEAQRIWQLVINSGIWFFGGPSIQNGEQFQKYWPNPSTVEYRRDATGNSGNWLYLRFENIHVTDFGGIVWENESVIGRRDNSEIIIEVDLPEGVGFNQEISHTFTAVQTLLDSAKTGFETAAKARLGGVSTPAGAELAQTVTKEFTRQFGQNDSFNREVRQRFDIPGPRKFKIEAVREQQRIRRQARCRPVFDYNIKMGRYWAQGHYYEAGFVDKAEFLSWIRGQAPDSVGYIVANFDSFGQWGDPNAAAFMRARPQSGAELSQADSLIIWPDEYDDVLRQTIEVVDVDGAINVSAPPAVPAQGAPEAGA